jgi:PEP-CTERM motif
MCYKNIYSLLIVALLISGASSIANAAPVNVSLDFVGPTTNTLNLTASGSGTTTTTMFGKLIKFFTGAPNPQMDPIGLSPDTISVASNPDRDPLNDAATAVAETASVVIESSTWTPISISNANLDLLNGQTLSFGIDQLVLEAATTPAGFFDPDSNIKIDLSGAFQSVKFYQSTNNIAFTGNTYAIPGTIRGIVDLNVNFDAFGGSLALNTGLGTQEFDAPFTLTGTLGVNTTGPQDATLNFDGLTSGAFLLSGISTTLTFDSFGAQVSLSLDVNGSIDLNFNYHLSDTAHVPEPGTFVLLGIGAIGLAPMIRRRLRKS